VIKHDFVLLYRIFRLVALL